jgi:hypothetical protein
MSFDTTLALILAATASNGILAGASLDQSLKQLPARHRIGSITYSRYSRAADLGNGILLYSILGIGAALLTLSAAVAGYYYEAAPTLRTPLYAGATLAVLHSFTSTQAAPTLFSQRQVAENESALAKIFTKFEKWQTARCVLQVINFAVLLWALAAYFACR